MARTFDEAELLERVDNDVGFLAETVEMLTSDGPSLLSQVREAVAAGDAPGAARAAHALKGMISNFCASEAHASALRLEKMGKDGDLASAGPALAAMDEQLAALTAELTGFIKERA